MKSSYVYVRRITGPGVSLHLNVWKKSLRLRSPYVREKSLRLRKEDHPRVSQLNVWSIYSRILDRWLLDLLTYFYQYTIFIISRSFLFYRHERVKRLCSRTRKHRHVKVFMYPFHLNMKKSESCFFRFEDGQHACRKPFRSSALFFLERATSMIMQWSTVFVIKPLSTPIIPCVKQ